MKILFAFLLVVSIFPVFAEPLADKTGLKTSFSVQAGSESFVVETTSNFDVRNVSFEEDRLVFALNSSLENNFGEIQIPQGIIQGEMTFVLDGQEITPKVLQNDKIAFVTLEFAGNGTHTLVMSSDYSVPPITEEQEFVYPTEKNDDILIILAAVGIVIAGGAGTTLAVYFKRKKA